MPKIRVNHFYKNVAAPGQVIEVDADEAAYILQRGGGTLVRELPARETSQASQGGDSKQVENRMPLADGPTRPQRDETLIETLVDFGLDAKHLEVLQAAGIKTVEQYAAVEDPTSLKGIGKATAAKIGEAIATRQAAASESDDAEESDSDEIDTAETDTAENE